MINGDDFILAALFRLMRAGKPIDLVVLADELERCGQIEQAGSYARLAYLWDMYSLKNPTGEN